MCCDGLVSKESLREETVGAMMLGAGVGVGRRWSHGWNTWWSVMVQLELPAVLAMVARLWAYGWSLCWFFWFFWLVQLISRSTSDDTIELNLSRGFECGD